MDKPKLRRQSRMTNKTDISELLGEDIANWKQANQQGGNSNLPAGFNEQDNNACNQLVHGIDFGDVSSDSDSDSDANQKGAEAVKQFHDFILDEIGSDITNAFSWLVVGKCGFGKSYAVKYILEYMFAQGYYKGGWCMTGTGEINKDQYSSWLPDHSIICGFSDEKIQAILNHLIAYKQETGKKPPRTFLILDDLLGCIRRSQLFEHFITTVRHYNCTVFMLTQNLRSGGVPPYLRENVRYKLFFQTGSRNLIKVFYNEFMGDYEGDEKDFHKLFKEATKEKHSALLVADQHDDPYRSFLAPAKYESQMLDFE